MQNSNRLNMFYIVAYCIITNVFHYKFPKLILSSKLVNNVEMLFLYKTETVRTRFVWNKKLKGLGVTGLGFFWGVLLFIKGNRENNEVDLSFADTMGKDRGGPFPITMGSMVSQFPLHPFPSVVCPASPASWLFLCSREEPSVHHKAVPNLA